MNKLAAAALCLFAGLAAAGFAFSLLNHMAALGPRGPAIVGCAMLVFFLLGTAGFLLLVSWRDDRRRPIPKARPASLPATPTGVYGLVAGRKYRVVRPIKDCYGDMFAVGEELTFVERHFLPYHGGHTIVFRPRPMYLQEDANADILGAFDSYLEIVPAPAPLRVWQARYSSTEIMCLELHEDSVRLELAGNSASEERWSCAQVLAGEADRSIRTGFSADVLTELKTLITARPSSNPPAMKSACPLILLFTLLNAMAAFAAPDPAAVSFSGVDYLPRWSQGTQHEYTPRRQDNLEHWTEMITINYYPDVQEGDGLAAKANAVLGNYKNNRAMVLKTSSVPQTADKPAEHLIAVLFPTEDLIEAVFTRFKIVNGSGLAITYSHREYGKKIGNKMSAWLAKNGPTVEKDLMSLDKLPPP